MLVVRATNGNRFCYTALYGQFSLCGCFQSTPDAYLSRPQAVSEGRIPFAQAFNAMKSSVFPLPNAKALLGFAWAIGIVVLFLLALDSFVSKPGVDSSLYIYASKGILEGDLPYLDRWVNKGPLLLLLNLIGLVIHKTWGLWIVQGLFLLGASTSAFLVLRRGFGIIPAFFAIALFLTFFSRFAPPGNFTEQYGLLFQFLTLYLFLRSHRAT